MLASSRYLGIGAGWPGLMCSPCIKLAGLHMSSHSAFVSPPDSSCWVYLLVLSLISSLSKSCSVISSCLTNNSLQMAPVLSTGSTSKDNAVNAAQANNISSATGPLVLNPVYNGECLFRGCYHVSTSNAGIGGLSLQGRPNVYCSAFICVHIHKSSDVRFQPSKLVLFADQCTSLCHRSFFCPGLTWTGPTICYWPWFFTHSSQARHADPHWQVHCPNWFAVSQPAAKGTRTSVVTGWLTHADFSAKETGLLHGRYCLLDRGLCYFCCQYGLPFPLLLEGYNAVPAVDPGNLLPFYSANIWLTYNQAFCIHTLHTTQLTDWSSMNLQLFNFQAASCLVCSSSLATSNKWPEPPGLSFSVILCNEGCCMAPFCILPLHTLVQHLVRHSLGHVRQPLVLWRPWWRCEISQPFPECFWVVTSKLSSQ